MDSRLRDLADKAIRYATESGAQYCDARAEQQVLDEVLIENGEIEYVRNNNDKGIGISLVKEGAGKVIPMMKEYYDIDFNVPLDNDVKIGYDWLDMEEV